MTKFSAVTLDLSRFPAPLAIRGLDFETIFAERKTRLLELFDEAPISYNVQTLEIQPAIIIEEADAYRELLIVAAINDAVRATMIAFAVRADLERLASLYGLVRRVITPAVNNQPAVMGSDTELRRCALLAPEAFSTAGTAGGYLFHALNADTRA